MPKLSDPNTDGQVIEFGDVPNCPKYHWLQLPHSYRFYKEGNLVSKFIKDGVLVNVASWGFIFNTFTELEGEYIKHVKRDLRNPQVWVMGSTERGGVYSLPVPKLMAWLNDNPTGLVVYVYFDSQTVLTVTEWETNALFAGLEASGVHFVWGMREA